MNEELKTLLEQHQTLYLQLKKDQKTLHELRRQINYILDRESFGFLVIPYFSAWKERP